MLIDKRYYIAYKAIPMTGYSTSNTGIKINNVTLLNYRLPNKALYESDEFSHYIYCVCVCYCLDIGIDFMDSLYDTKTNTIHIVNKGLIRKDRDDEYFYFIKKVIKKYMLYEYTSKIHADIANRLEEVKDISKTYNLRINSCIDKLIKYSDKKITHKLRNDMYVNKSIVTYSGYKIPDIRLALSYYVRNQDVDNSVKCIMELLRIDNYPISKVAKLMCKVAIEEVGVADPDTVIYLLHYTYKGKIKTNRLIDIICTLATNGTSGRVNRLIIKHDEDIETDREHSLSKYMRKCNKTFKTGTDNVTDAICKFEFWYEKERNSKCVYYINRLHYMSYATNIKAKIDGKPAIYTIWSTMNDMHDYTSDIYKTYKLMGDKKIFTVFCALLYTELDDYKYATPELIDGEEYYKYIKSPYRFKISDEVRKLMNPDKEESEGDEEESEDDEDEEESEDDEDEDEEDEDEEDEDEEESDEE